MVGRGGLEPPTSRLSGVRSNHLSYRPMHRPDTPVPTGSRRAWLSNVKGYEDGPTVECEHLTDALLSRCTRRAGPSASIFLRKEVIQPQVPLRLPCYDFTPVAEPTVVRCPPCGLAHGRRVDPTPMV